MFNNTTESPLHVHSLKLIIPTFTVYSIIFIVGLFGNVFTCVVIVRNKFMHTATNCYLFSLAVSDLILILLDLWPYILESVFWNTTQPNSTLGECVGQSYVPGIAIHNSILTIMAFTIDRYVAICHPFKSSKLMDIGRVKRIIITIWIASAFISVPQIFGGYPRHCNLKYNFMSAILPYVKYSYIINLVLIFFGPLVLLTVLYILIGLTLKRGNKLPSNSIIEEKKIVKMLVVVVVSFFICWTPFQCCRIYYTCFVDKGTYEELLQDFTSQAHMAIICGSFFYTSTAVNPIIYNLMSNKFRKAFRSTFMRKQQETRITTIRKV